MRHLIIGSGVFGLTTAISLRQRGHEVIIVDQGAVPHPDAASTDISKVVRMDYGSDAQHTDMGMQAIDRWRQWNDQWGEQLYHEDGFLVLSEKAMRPGSFEHDSHQCLMRKGVPLRRVGTLSLMKDFPAWKAERYTDGYLNTEGGWAESGRVIARLRGDAIAAGAQLFEHVPFGRLLDDGERVTGMESADGRRFLADITVMAAGAWTPIWLPHLRDALRVTGQPVLLLRPADARLFQPKRFPVWAADIGTTGWYGFPVNSDGIVKVANHGPGRAVDPRVPREVYSWEIERFRAFLRESLPALADAPLAGSRLCLYCDTFDGSFWIDHDRQHPGLVVATGDSGHAFKFAPVLGDLIADIIERRVNPWSARYATRVPTAAHTDGARQAVASA